MEAITKQENLLFEKWKKDKESFICDGVANEKKWNQATVKILFLLREVNDCSNEFDEREYLNDYTNPKYMRSKTIDNLALWAYGIQKRDDYYSWPQAEYWAKNSDILQSIALMNIKKSSGGGTVDWDNFEKYFAVPENQDYIKQQLNIYQSADIIVCGGTAYYLNCLYPEKFKEDLWTITNKGIRYIWNDKKLYIDYVHPNIRAPKNIIYFALLDALNEIYGTSSL